MREVLDPLVVPDVRIDGLVADVHQIIKMGLKQLLNLKIITQFWSSRTISVRNTVDQGDVSVLKGGIDYFGIGPGLQNQQNRRKPNTSVVSMSSIKGFNFSGLVGVLGWHLDRFSRLHIMMPFTILSEQSMRLFL